MNRLGKTSVRAFAATLPVGSPVCCAGGPERRTRELELASGGIAGYGVAGVRKAMAYDSQNPGQMRPGIKRSVV